MAATADPRQRTRAPIDAPRADARPLWLTLLTGALAIAFGAVIVTCFPSWQSSDAAAPDAAPATWHADNSASATSTSAPTVSF